MLSDKRLREQVARLSILLSLFLAAARPGYGQATGAGTPGGYTPPAPITSTPTSSVPTRSATTPSGQPQSPFQGSVPTGQATGTTLALSLKDAFDHALKYNLGVIERRAGNMAAAPASPPRWMCMSAPGSAPDAC